MSHTEAVPSVTVSGPGSSPEKGTPDRNSHLIYLSGCGGKILPSTHIPPWVTVQPPSVNCTHDLEQEPGTQTPCPLLLPLEEALREKEGGKGMRLPRPEGPSHTERG